MARIQSPAGAKNTLDGVAWPEGGGDINLVAGGSLTLTPNNATKEIIMSVSSGTGSLPEGWVLASDHGVVGDGITNDSAAIQAAENVRQSVNGVLIFDDPGTYLVTTQIDVGDRCAWFGLRTERGTNTAPISTGNYYSVRINWRPAVSSTRFISEFRTDSNDSTIGPYQFEDIHFDFAGNNGIELGRDPVDSGSGTNRYTHGIRFARCNFSGTHLGHHPTTKVLPRTNNKHLSFGKDFETVIEDCSFFGGDTHIYSRGSDTPHFARCRSQAAMIPIEIQSGFSDVPGVIEGFQMELWYICAMIVNGQRLRVDNCRWENTYPGSSPERLALPETFSVTAGSGVITASATMTNVLIPGASLLELTSGANKDTVLVTAVSGTSVIVDTNGFTFDWTAGAATATRIHGHGIVTRGSAMVSVGGGSPNAAVDTPVAVYSVGPGYLSLSQLLAPTGIQGDVRPIVVGNRYMGQPYLDAGMIVDGCSPEVTPNPAAPFVHVTYARSNHGEWNRDPNRRSWIGDLAEETAVARKRWVFTPKSSAHEYQNMATTRLLRLVAGETNTAEQIASWSVNASATLDLINRTLPTSGYIRVTVKARTKTTSGTLSVRGIVSGTSSTTLMSRSITTGWGTFVFFGAVPTADWSTSRISTTETGMEVFCDQAYYVGAVEIEELIGPFDAWGSGTPESNVSAPVGSTYKRSDGGTNTSFYIKQSGTGNTGWAAVTP